MIVDTETTAKRKDDHQTRIGWAIAALSLTMLLSALSTSIANVGLPTLAEVFEVSFQQIQWVVIAYLLSITVFIVSVGRLGDVVGRRRLMVIGLTVFALASIASGVSSSASSLIAARVVQGVGAAIMMALAMALVSDVIGRNRTGSAMGLLGAMSAVGTALGPSMGGLLIDTLGWRSIFLVNAPLAALAMLLLVLGVPSDPRSAQTSSKRFDVVGTVLLATGLGGYALAMTLGNGELTLSNLVLLLCSLAVFAAFVRQQRYAQSPLIRIGRFKDRVLRRAFVMNAIVAMIVMATLVIGPFYLAGGLDLDPIMIGLVMSAGPVVAALTGIPAGRLSDRFGPSRVTLAGLGLMLVGCAALGLSSISMGVPGYVVPLMITTAGYALFQASNNTAVMRDVDPDERGVTSALLNLSRNLGLLSGASFMGAIFAFGVGDWNAASATKTALSNGLALTFSVAACLVASMLLWFWIRNPRREREADGSQTWRP